MAIYQSIKSYAADKSNEMILDRIENLGKYSGICPDLSRINDFLLNTDVSDIPFDCRIEIPDSGSFLYKRTYRTKAEGNQLFEAHRKYIDLQYVVSGHEIVKYSEQKLLSQSSPYDEAADCELFSGEGKSVKLDSGDFVILFPQDAHIPKLNAEDSCEVVKIVLKISMKD